MSISLGSGVDEAIRAHGAETYPNECCGALIGRNGVVTATYALPNTTEEGPRRRFLVRPQDYREAEKRASEMGAELLGFYHSHPDHPALWSQTDFAEAHWFSCSYVITSVEKGKAVLTNSFELTGTDEDDKKLEKEKIEMT